LRDTPEDLAILVRKGERRLVLLAGGREVFACRVALGGEPVGPKRREGDRRTPEGSYTVCTRNARSRYRLFLGLSYPGPADAERGLREGAIAPAEHEAILAAAREGRAPPWKTALGGEIGIHGSGSSADWTLGCIALDDADVETLWGLCPLGTPVTIEP
jgi:murein L,D-transpeptidase YafK